jgi:hypothetical protein
MCWNATSSLTSFIVGYIICLILFIRNKDFDRYYSVFFLWIITVQLCEYLMWIDQECKSLNNIGNQILCPMILLQPIVLAFISLYFIKFDTITTNILIISTIISLIVVVISYITMGTWKEKQCSKPKENQCHSLQWPWLKKNNLINTTNYFIMLVILFISLFLINNIYLKVFVIYLLATLFISQAIKPFNNSGYSHWCFFSVGLPLLKLII